MKLAGAALAGLVAGALIALAVLYWNPWPPEPDASGLPVVCDRERDSCWQRGTKVEAPDLYEECAVGSSWRPPPIDDEVELLRGPFAYVYSCRQLGE